eukprot:3890899-Pyramimonas_sp.AAC.1
MGDLLQSGDKKLPSLCGRSRLRKLLPLCRAAVTPLSDMVIHEITKRAMQHLLHQKFSVPS